ncbi:MAG: glycosyltransferase family 4 protein, partial [Rhabdaerophilum calidifontis]
MRALFLAPMKPPDHPVPSGDRTIARLFVKLLGRLGYSVEIASTLRSFDPAPDAAADAALLAAGQCECARILAAERGRPPPALVFCYHLYHKAPDVIGPALAAELGVPYIVAEASRAPKRAEGPFARRYALAEAAIGAARLHLCPTARDRAMLAAALRPGQALVDLKPFLDLAPWPLATALPARPAGAALRLLSVAMMREGYKQRSYALLAAALARLGDLDFTLDIVGDGPARAAVAAAFAPLGPRVRLHGRIEDPVALGHLYAGADLFLWPAIDEPFGMVFLEAQAHGLPCLAGDGGGVADVIRAGETGLLVPQGDAAAFAAAIRALAADRARLAALGSAAWRFVRGERSLPAAAARVAAA